MLVTGANGFVGGALLGEMKRRRIEARTAARREIPGAATVRIESLDASTRWDAALEGCKYVVHLAARVHVMSDTAADPLAEFRKVNVEGTESLARQAARAGVRRFVYLSSIKVNGEETQPGRPFKADDPVNPSDPYGKSKAEAEARLRAIAAETGMEVAVIRPVLVYGPGVKANFESIMRWLVHGMPLPLGAIRNARSLVALGNLVDLIITCLTHPAAANQVFLVSDGEDLSTPELLRRTARALGTTARLLPMPSGLLQTAAGALGKGDVGRRLCGSLQVDIAKTRMQLGWSPPLSVDRALAETAADFLARRGSA